MSMDDASRAWAKFTHAADEMWLPLPMTADEVRLFGETVAAFHNYRGVIHARQAEACERIASRMGEAGAETLADLIEAADAAARERIESDLRMAGHDRSEVDEVMGR